MEILVEGTAEIRARLRQRGRAKAIDSDVGQRVRELRALRGLSRAELARQLGVSYQQIHKYESGANCMSLGVVLEIARILQVGVAAILAGLPALDDDGAAGQAMDEQPALAERRLLLRLFRDIEDPRLRRQVMQVVAAIVAIARQEAEPANGQA